MSNCTNNFIKRVIGVTRTFKWTVTTNGAAVPLVAEDLTLQLVPPRGEAVSLPFDVDDNIVSFTWQGEDQHIIGCYSLILWANFGEDNQRRVDIHNFVELIPWSDRQSGEYSDLVEETIELETADFGENIMVVDNLNSTSATDALSANMGRQLNVTKQDVIQDLATIRSGAAAGAAVKEWAKNDPLITDDATQATASKLSFNGNLFEQWISGIASSIGLKGIAGFLKLADISQWDSAYNDRMLPTVAAVKAKLQAVLTALGTIEAVIPSQASSTNKLTDKDYVDGAIATNTANFVGTFDTLAELQAVQNPTKNDYGFVIEQDAQGNEYYDRYKYTGTQWLFEYKVESTPFTAEQWAAIQSGITAALVSKLSALPTNAELNTALASKQPVINDLTTIRSGAAAGATAYQKPSGGIPKTDLASAVQASLGKADAAAPQATTYTKMQTDSLLNQKQNTLTFDSTPTEGSTNPVTSAGISSALQSKADTTALTPINGAISTNAANIAQLQSAYAALTQSAVVIGALPASGVANTIYRVPDTATYSDYMWNGSQFVLMATYDNAIDDTPMDGSSNLVKSGGVANYVGLPVVVLEYSAAMVRSGANLGTIILRAGHTYRAYITRTEARNNQMYVCSGTSSSSLGTTYMNLNLNSSAPLSKEVFYTNDTGADITANVIVAGNWSSGYWVNPHLIIDTSNNNLVWTSAQKMTGEQMKQVLANIGASKAPIEFYEDKTFFVDGSTWETGRSGTYACRVIPVTGGGKIVCTGPDPDLTNIASGISFLNTFDEAYILANLPCPVDGTANNNILPGETRSFDIPSTCTYIALRSRYSSSSLCLPQSLVINGMEYMQNTADYLASLVMKESGSTTYERNITKDAAVRATGKKAVTATDILPLSLIHVSDIHTKADNYKCFKNACEYIENYENIAAMIVTGDLVWDSYADPMTYYDEAVQGVTKPVLNVIGNHDAGQYKSALGLASVSTDVQCYERYIAPYVDGWDVTQPSDAATAGKSYYYKDFTDQKVRLIVLCEFETDYELNAAGTGLVYSREYRAMRQAQVTWLIDTLTNTPSDYGVIVAMHQPLGILGAADNAFVSFDLVGGYKYSVYSEDREWLAKVVNAYATKSALTLSVAQTGAVVTTLNCNCDFTGVQSEFICVLCGHTHRDYIGRLANYPSIPILCVGADNLLYTSGFQPRAEGTPSEDLFNVVNIDRNRKTIKIVRIGSDASVTGQVRDQLLMSYE